MKKQFTVYFKKVCLCLALILSINPAYSQCPKLVWSDEFDGTSLNPNKWSYQIGNGCDLGSCGWGNNELQYYTDRNVSVSNGNMVITAKKERTKTNEYTSSRIRSIHKGDFLYGRMEARIKLPIGKGIWPAFWMMPTDEVYGAWPQSGEVDIMENRGSVPNVSHGTMHYGGLSPDNKYSTGHYKLPNGQLNEDFHIYAIEWEPNQIRWYIDGILYSVKTDKDIVAPYKWPFDQKFHLILNIAVGGNYDGSPDASTVFPQSMMVDYVRVYDTGMPYIEGPDVVQVQTDVAYTVNPVANATYTWSVPTGATIIAGQGTNSIQVKWGDYQGQVKVAITQDCGAREYAKLVYTKNINYEFSFQNFDDQRNLIFHSASGRYEPFLGNPVSATPNQSPLVGKYTRSNTTQYDVLSYTVSQIKDASDYSTKKKKLFMDVYTAAPVNTLVIIHLDNRELSAGQPHPTGRHSRYVARTTKQNQWERLEFELDAILDTSVPNNSVNAFNILFASDTYTGDTYYIDNIDSYTVGIPTSGDDKQAPTAPTNLTSTGKTETSVSLSWTAATDNIGVTGYDISRNGTLVGSTTSTNFMDQGLSASTSYSYTVKAKDAAGNVSAASNTLSVTTNAPSNVTLVKVEAESYTAMRNVSTQPCADAGGGLNVASIDNRDFMDYTVTIPASGTYKLEFRVASGASTGKFDLRLGTTTLASISVPNTGSGQTWVTVTASTQASLTSGTHTFKIVGTGSTSNLNWFSFTSTGNSGSVSRLASSQEAEKTNLSLITVFPNPASGSINIHSNNQEPIDIVEIISMTRIVKVVHPNKESVTLPLSGLARGLYILRIGQGSQVILRKVVVE